MTILSNGRTSRPSHRRLRVFAFDPILSRRIETHDINEVIIKLPWEDNIKLGPVDDYLEIVDYDPATQAFYAPVDLNDKFILAQDGLSPSDGNPCFHQQMAYAIARNTILCFEQALGRRALWSSRLIQSGNVLKNEYVEHLRIYPHALREANAYYSPVKKALLFGYFPASTTDPGENMPGETVFTCLSHDIVAHEMAHALLDGMHKRFIEPTNIDVWPFHEAFADIVALFLHFSHPEVLRHQIAHTRGDLQSQNLLGELAFQFGQAIGRYGALRSAIGKIDKLTKKWIPEEPDPEKIQTATEAHARGAILVAAVFDAFLTIYKWRIADLLRIATGGTGLLPQGEIHPDLVERLAQEAAKTARHILFMCIRALDYCPPVDIDFGDYLRALITADANLVTDDRLNYRLAVIDAFRKRGIYPRDVRNLSEESLLWDIPDEKEQNLFFRLLGNPERLGKLIPDWGLSTNRGKIFNQAERSQAILHKWFTDPNSLEAASLAHLVLDNKAPEAFYRDKSGIPALEVHSVRPARRVGPNGETITELVIEITQRRRGYYDSETQDMIDRGKKEPQKADFIYRGGCTLLVDPESSRVKYCIYKRIRSKNRLDRMRRFLLGNASPSLRTIYFADPKKVYFERLTAQDDTKEEKLGIEAFGLLHRSFEQEEEIK